MIEKQAFLEQFIYNLRNDARLEEFEAQTEIMIVGCHRVLQSASSVLLMSEQYAVQMDFIDNTISELTPIADEQKSVFLLEHIMNNRYTEEMLQEDLEGTTADYHTMIQAALESFISITRKQDLLPLELDNIHHEKMAQKIYLLLSHKF